MRDDHDLFTYKVAKVGFAFIAAFALGSMAHHDLGLSRYVIRISALALAALTALPIVIDGIRTIARKPR